METSEEGTESGSTATAIFLRNDVLFISHVGDSCVVYNCSLIFIKELYFVLDIKDKLPQFASIMQSLSRSGKAEVLTNSHRPYGNNKVSLREIRRIREAGGWVCISILSYNYLPEFICIKSLKKLKSLALCSLIQFLCIFMGADESII